MDNSKLYATIAEEIDVRTGRLAALGEAQDADNVTAEAVTLGTAVEGEKATIVALQALRTHLLSYRLCGTKWLADPTEAAE